MLENDEEIGVKLEILKTIGEGVATVDTQELQRLYEWVIGKAE